jgi:hypothetical protein
LWGWSLWGEWLLLGLGGLAVGAVALALRGAQGTRALRRGPQGEG